MSTLTLEEAAEFLKVHPETLRQKVKAGDIPASKIGRAWVFIEEDLVEAIRVNYSSNWRAIQANQNVKEEKLWPCIDEVKTACGGSTLQSPMDDEYESLLARKTKEPQLKCMIVYVANFGLELNWERNQIIDGKMQ